MRYETKETLISIGIYAAVLAVSMATLVSIAYVGSQISCKAKWEDSGMPWRYGPFMGCQVQTKPGKWIPADRFREMD